MSHYMPLVAREPLGKLYYDHRDVGALKCLVAIRMTKRRVDVEVAPPRMDLPKVKSVNPLLFTAAGGNVRLRDPFAIAWFLANYDFRSHDNWLPDRYGAQILQWNSFSVSELKPHLIWLLGGDAATVRGGAKTKLRQQSLASSLDALNAVLREKRFLAGERFTLADVCVAADLVPLLDPGWSSYFDNPSAKDLVKKHHVYLCEWYDAVASRSIFKLALADFRLPTEASIPNGMGGDVVAKPPRGKGAARRKRQAKLKLPGEVQAEADVVKAAVPAAAGSPLKILCLHGYRQNGGTFRQKIGGFRRMFGNCIEFNFVTAPHRVTPVSAEDANQDQRGWWLKSDDEADCHKGLDESLELIQKTFEAKGPFHGVMGFSQGAALAALLCLMAERKPELLSSSVKFDFVMLFASYRSSCSSSKHASWYDFSDGFKGVSVPSLHVMGSGDRVIESAASEQLLDLFQCPTVIRHQGGHFVPASKGQKQPYFDFLMKVRGDSAAAPEGKDENQNPSGGSKKVAEDKSGAVEAPAVAVAAV